MAEEDIRLDALLYCLLGCSEKAAKIAQIFRGENDLFHLLVEEKSDIEKNKRFVQDFKTLADVLVQETIKKDVGERFPSIITKIQGEEQNSFQNTLGESIKVELTASTEETTHLLCKVLDGKRHIAEILAAAVHDENSGNYTEDFASSLSMPANRIGIWIDPIDSTAEYIQAKHNCADEHGIETFGLKCVCVLIGVYDTQNGNPVLGIINQPFYNRGTNISKWESKVYWGICYDSEKVTSSTLHNEITDRRKIIVTSSSENDNLQKILKMKYSVVHAAGAGYKCLLVASKKAEMYILSQGTTYFWDTCGPHATLLAQGGGMLNFLELMNATDIKNCDDLLKYQIKYSSEKNDIHSFRNSNGIIAYKDPNDVLEMLHLLQENGYSTNN